MKSPDAPIANKGFFVTHFLTVKDQARSKEFYVGILGGKVVKPENPRYIKLENSWIILNSGGGPTPDKPEVVLETPQNLNRVSSFLNLRVADIRDCYKKWSAKGAHFLTEPLDNHGHEWRCYMRDPDGYLIEVGEYSQTSLDHFKEYMANPEPKASQEVDTKLEVVVIPVVDVDRAKKFYGKLGWRLDADFPFDNGFRVVQFTPPGSGCSVQFGTNMTSSAPGSAYLYLIVSDIEAAREELVARGVDVSKVFHPETPGAQFQPDGASGRVIGPAPDHATYRSFAAFHDPDGNGWLLQEVTTRLPGRIDAAQTAFASAADLASALRRAETAHGEHEKRTGQRDANWSDWYAEYIVNEQSGKELPQ